MHCAKNPKNKRSNSPSVFWRNDNEKEEALKKFNELWSQTWEPFFIRWGRARFAVLHSNHCTAAVVYLYHHYKLMLYIVKNKSFAV